MNATTELLPGTFLPHIEAPAPAVRLLSRPQDQAGDAASFGYDQIIDRLARARDRVEIHLYVWREDQIGTRFGRALLDAADRGVEISILKDTGAVLFEGQEDNRRSFLPMDLSWSKKAIHRLIGMTLPDSRVVSESGLGGMGTSVLEHPRISVRWVAPTHTKYFLIDEEVLFLGSLNLEDRHLGYHDALVEITEPDLIEDFLNARAGAGESFLFNRPEEDEFPIAEWMLRWIDEAERFIHLEMAYLGDPEITEALVQASKRGVRVRILTSAKANIGDDLNKLTLETLLREAPEIEIALSPKMIHTKLMVIDEKAVTLGSANASVFSLRRAGEANLFLRDEAFADQVIEICQIRWDLAKPVAELRDLGRFNRVLARLQQWHQVKADHN